MPLPGIVKLLLCGAIAGGLGGVLGGLAPLCRSAVLGLLLTLAIPILNRLSRRAKDEEEGLPLRLAPTLVCGAVVGLLLAGAGVWLDARVPYAPTAPYIPGWAQHLSALLFGILVLLAYRLRLRSPRWHASMPFLVWGGAAVADGVRFLPLVARAPSFAGPAFLGGLANVSVFVLGWLLALKLHDPEYQAALGPADQDPHGDPKPIGFAVMAARGLAAAVVLVCGAFLFARQVGFAHLWHTAIVWHHPELAERLTGRLYTAPLTTGSKKQLDLRRSNPEESWPALLERSTQGDAIVHGDVFFVGERSAIRAWNLKTGEMTIEFPMEWASIALSPDGSQLACVGNHAGDPVDALRLAILRTTDGTMTHELSPGFRRDGICWTADGERLVGVLGPDTQTDLAVIGLSEEGAMVLGPGRRPHLDPQTGEILFLYQDALWRRDLANGEPERIATGMTGVRDYCFTDDPALLLVSRERLNRFGATRHYLLMVDLADPGQRHLLSATQVPSWCLWESSASPRK